MIQSDLDLLRSKLPRDWAKRIAFELKLTPDQVRKVIRGDSANPKIIASAVRLANQTKRSNILLSQEIASL